MPPAFTPLYVVLVTGDRDWDDMSVVEGDANALLEQHNPNNLIIIHGGAPGLDTIWDIVGKKKNMHTAKVDALWSTRHKGAGPQRNSVMGRLVLQMMMGTELLIESDGTDFPEAYTQEMLGECLAYHNNIKKSRGTKNMVKWCKRNDVPVFPRGFKLKDVT